MSRTLMFTLVLLAACVPKNADEHLRYADGERVRGKTARARSLYRDFLEKYPGDAQVAQVRLNLGMTYFEQQSYANAVREFTVVANDHPDHPALWKALLYGGVAHARLGNCPQALQYLSVVVGGTEGRTAPPDLQREAQDKMDAINDDMQGRHEICTVKPRG